MMLKEKRRRCKAELRPPPIMPDPLFGTDRPRPRAAPCRRPPCGLKRPAARSRSRVESQLASRRYGPRSGLPEVRPLPIRRRPGRGRRSVVRQGCDARHCDARRLDKRRARCVPLEPKKHREATVRRPWRCRERAGESPIPPRGPQATEPPPRHEPSRASRQKAKKFRG